MHLPSQGAWVAVGTRALRENAKLDRELHDSMSLREFTRLNISLSPSASLSLSLSEASQSLSLPLSSWRCSWIALLCHSLRWCFIPRAQLVSVCTNTEKNWREKREGPAPLLVTWASPGTVNHFTAAATPLIVYTETHKHTLNQPLEPKKNKDKLKPHSCRQT